MMDGPVRKYTVTLKLNNGLDSMGNVKTVNISLGSLSTQRWDQTKAMNIVSLLDSVLAKEIYETQGTTVQVLTSA